MYFNIIYTFKPVFAAGVILSDSSTAILHIHIPHTCYTRYIPRSSWSLKMGPIRCSEMSVTHQPTLRNMSEDRISLHHHGGSLKPRGAAHCAYFSILLFLPLLWFQMFSSAPCPQAASVCVVPLRRKTTVHCRTNHFPHWSTTLLSRYVLSFERP